MITCNCVAAKRGFRIALWSASVMLGAFSYGAASADTAAPKAIADKGVITYCTDISFPPLEFYDQKTNEPAGFDIDLGKAVAEEMGVKAEFKNISFDGLIPAVQAGQCDAIISGLFDKPNRREVLDFVNYAYLGNSVIVKADSNLSFNSLEELSGKTAATETGTQLEQDLVAANEKITKDGKPPIKWTACEEWSGCDVSSKRRLMPSWTGGGAQRSRAASLA
jgi:polar amino acid transport system substrate-binding protein